MAFENHETIQRLFQRFFRDEWNNLTADERAAFERQFESRFGDLLVRSSANGAAQFADLIGLSPGGPKPFEQLGYPTLKADFDEAVIPSQLHAAAELYFIYSYERMRIFSVARVLRRLFRDGQIRVQRGPGARGLYLIEKQEPLRYKRQDRLIAYKRVFNYGPTPAPAGAIVNTNFHFQLVAFMSAMAQYFRDLTISDVIKSSATITERPFGSAATVQRLGVDLRYALDRASYGNILALTQETGQYLSTVLELLDASDIKKAFDANTKYDVLEQVTNRYLGGAVELSQRAKMAESGRRVLQCIADNDFRTTLDLNVFNADGRPIAQQAEAWIAAYRLTQDGRRFPGVDRQLRWAIGLGPRDVRMTA